MDTQEAVRIILEAILKNKDIIVFHTNVKWAWRINRLFHHLPDNEWVAIIRNIRRLRQDPLDINTKV
jgi:hypothetical protein